VFMQTEVTDWPLAIPGGSCDFGISLYCFRQSCVEGKGRRKNSHQVGHLSTKDLVGIWEKGSRGLLFECRFCMLVEVRTDGKYR
jgi:hypothetical protein